MKTDIITYPIKLTREYSDSIKESADKLHLSKNKFILGAIAQRIKRGE